MWASHLKLFIWLCQGHGKFQCETFFAYFISSVWSHFPRRASIPQMLIKCEPGVEKATEVSRLRQMAKLVFASRFFNIARSQCRTTTNQQRSMVCFACTIYESMFLWLNKWTWLFYPIFQWINFCSHSLKCKNKQSFNDNIF